MKILITGASGFVGLALIRRLVAQGGHSIIAVHKNPLKKNISDRFDKTVTWVRADLTIDDLSSFLMNVETVFHLAAYCSMSESNSERALMENLNVNGTKRVAKACKNNGVTHFIFVSSIAACESGNCALIDEVSGFPVTSYGRTKKSAEDFLLGFYGEGFEVTILRPTALFGENHLGSVFELVKVINAGKFIMFGQGSGLTNFYYIHDFIDVLIAIKNDKRSYGQIFIASDQSFSLSELVSFICAALKTNKFILHVPTFIGLIMAAMFDGVSFLFNKPMPLSKRRFNAMIKGRGYSNEKLKHVLGIVPSHGLQVAINNTVDWYRSEGLI
jgi:nucleoside-diphosphate-sugar epimerase